MITFHHCSAEQTSLTDQNQVKELFVEAFATSYHLSGAYTELSDSALRTHLQNDFEKTLRPMFHSQPPKLFLAAKHKDRLVGYTLFETISDDTIYVAELAIRREFWRQGLGKKMTLFLADTNPKIRKVVVLTERINLQAQAFYESIGFQPSAYMHEGYSPDQFRAYEKRFQ